MKLKKSTVHLDDFGSSSEIWSEGFLNYVIVMSDFFGTTFPSLVRVLLRFHSQIKMLSKIYDWRGAVIPLAIEYHTEVTAANHTDVDAWTLPQHWIDTYCTPQYVTNGPLSALSKKRAATSSPDGHASKKRTSQIFSSGSRAERWSGHQRLRSTTVRFGALVELYF